MPTVKQAWHVVVGRTIMERLKTALLAGLTAFLADLALTNSDLHSTLLAPFGG